MIDYLTKGFRCLFRNKLRASLTIIGIAVGVMSIVIVTTIGSIGKNEINNELTGMGMESLVVSAYSNGITALKQEQLESIQNIENVKNAMPLISRFSTSEILDKSYDCMIWGVNEDANEVIDLSVIHGRLINKGDIIANKNVCVIDESIAISSYNRSNIVGKKIQVAMNGTNQEFEVVGVVKNGVNLLQNMLGQFIPDFVYIPYSTFQSAYFIDSYDQITVKLKSSDDSEEISRKIERIIESQDNVETVTVENLVKQKEKMDNIMNTASVALSAVAAISLIVSGISIMTVMLVSVNERTREIGIKKSIGATNINIMSEFLMESILITILGAGLGLSAGLLMSLASCLVLNITPIIDTKMCISVIIFSIITGAVFGVYPAYRAASLKPVDALRYE